MTWREEDHPRVPAGRSTGGQFTEKDGGAGLDPELEALRKERREAFYPEDAKQEKRFYAYKQFHDSTQEKAAELGQDQLEYEMAQVVGEEGEVSRELGSVEEGGMAIRFSEEELETLQGRRMVHNHPNNSGFSRADLQFGAKYGLEVIVATTKDGMFVADFNREVIDSNVNFYSDKIGRLFDELSGMVDADAKRKIKNGYTVEEALAWRGQEMAEILSKWDRSKNIVQARWVPWKIPEKFLPGGRQ